MERVARGEEVILTYRGRDAARIVPVEERRPPFSKADSAAIDELFGLWCDREDLPDVQAHVDHLRRSRY